MFTVKQKVMLQAAAAAVIVFFLALIGEAEAGAAVVWGLVVALALFLLIRQNIIVSGGGDVVRGVGPMAAMTGSATARADTVAKPAPSDPAPPPAPVPGTSSAAVDAGATDDLKRIKGIGPKVEEELNAHGIHQFRQIADWGADKVAWADEELAGVKGQATRNEWVRQARRLVSKD